MNKIFTLRKALTGTLASGCLLLLQTSCVSDEYDITNLDKTVSVGGDISLSLGSTDSIKLGSMLDINEIENLETINGKYKITMKDSIIQKIELTDEPVTLEQIDVNNPIASEFDKPSFPDINLAVPDSKIEVNPGMETVDLSSAQSNNVVPPTAINFTKPRGVNFSLPNIVINEILSVIVIDDSKGDAIIQDNNLTIEGIKCPSNIKTVNTIYFGQGANGTLAEITIDINDLNDCVENLDAKLPSTTFEFSTDYTLSLYNNTGLLTNNHTITFTDVTAVNGKFYFKFYIDKYTKTLNNITGTLEDIKCDIKTTLANKINILGGVTNGQDIKINPEFILNISAPLKVKDMDLVVSDVEVAVDEKNPLCADPVEIGGIPTLIKSVKEVELSPESKMTININALELPLTANSMSQDITYLKFPTSKYVLKSGSYTDIANGFYRVSIPLDGIANGTPYSKDIYIEKIILTNETLLPDGETQKIEFMPEIKTSDANIVLGGNLTTSKFNTFVEADPQTMTIKVVSDKWKVKNSNVVIDDLVAEIEPITKKVDVDASIPDELVRVDSVKFQNKVYTTMNVAVKIAGLDSKLSFENYKIEFPKFIQFSKDGLLQGNTLNLHGQDFIKPYTGSNQTENYVYTKQLEVIQLDLTDPKYSDIIKGEEGNKKIFIDTDSIRTTGNIKLEGGGNASTDEMEKYVTGNVSVVVDEMVIGETYGKVLPDLEIDGSTIDLAELSEAFDGSLSASLSNPSITLDIVNSLPVPMKIDSLILRPMKGGKALNKLYTTTSIIVDGALEGGVNRSQVIISAYDKESSDEVTYVKMQNFKKILNDLPDSIAIDIVADVVGENHSLNLAIPSYDLSINYALDVPLEFDALTLDYTTTIDGLDEGLSEIVDYIDTLKLKLDIMNLIPLDLEIESIIPLDVYGNKLELNNIVVDGKNTINGDSNSSIVELVLSDNDNILEQLSSLEINIKGNATSTINGTALSPNQFLKINIIAQVPGGLTMNLDDLDI